MTGNRNRNAWIWVAIAALSFASVAREEARLQTARTFAHPVLEFLAKSYAQETAAKAGASGITQRGTMHRIRAIFREAGAGTWVAILPVCCAGLISLLSLCTCLYAFSLSKAPAQPLLSALFQRPPPQLV